MQKQLFSLFTLSALFLGCYAQSSYSAIPINLQKQPTTALLSVQSLVANQSQLKEISAEVDFNQTTHMRVQQTYAGYKVWGADVVAHIPHANGATLNQLLAAKATNTTWNGTVYQNLNADLNQAPAYIFSDAQKTKALQQASMLYSQQTANKSEPNQQSANLIVYIDKDNKAHWAFVVTSLFVPATGGMPAKPVYIIDATSFAVYRHWNDIKTLDDASAGGFGGNPKMGKLVFDGLPKDQPSFTMQRDAKKKMCFVQNSAIVVKDVRKKDAIAKFPCKTPDKKHNKIYWDGEFDMVNGGYSPTNDALFIGGVVKNMYQDWYGIPVLVDSANNPMLLTMRVHENMENAYWDGEAMTFGDGGTMFYPLVSLGVGAHEISHGFTEQHSNLVYDYQSGGLNEAFSDMAAQAAEYYAYQKNSWQIGPEIMKDVDEALRYMDDPTKDCHGSAPGQDCSIGNVKDYSDGLDVHYSSGVFNKLFYLMGSADGWNAKKAFDVMVQANRNYWTSEVTFAQAACGVKKAAEDLKYDTSVVDHAASGVGLDTSSC